jgi:CSLREA domain-containing protein
VRRGRYAFVFFALLVGATVVGRSAHGAPAPCTLAPQLRDVTIAQGVGSYSPLEYGKETLARLYLSMPSCAASGASVQVTDATLTMSGGASASVRMTPTPSPTAYPVIATFSAAPSVDSTGDPKFVIPGSSVSPTGGAAFNTTFTATVNYQAKASRTATPVAGSVTFNRTPTSLTNPAPSANPISASFDRKTNAFHVLVVPMGDASKVYSSQFGAAAQAAVQDGMTGTLSRIFPVAAGVGNLGSLGGEGLQYTITPTLLPLNALRDSSGSPLLDSTGKFCGTGASYDAIKGQLYQMLRTWQTGNPGIQVDSVLGAIDPLIAKGPPDPCFEGMGSLGSAEAWTQAITGRGGQLSALELAHTLGMTPKDRESPFDAGHSQNITAENPQLNRRYNVVQRAFIPTDRSLMKPSASSPAPDNNNTLFEAPDFAYARSVFGGTPTAEFTQFPKTLGGITSATLAFVMSGTTASTSGLAPGSTGSAPGTNIVESYYSSQTQLTDPDPNSGYFLRQIPGQTRGVPVSFADSEHGGSATTHPAPSALFSIAQVADPNATRVELWKGTPGATGSLLLYARDKSTPPVINGMTTGSGPLLSMRVSSGDKRLAPPPPARLRLRHTQHAKPRHPAGTAGARKPAASARALAGNTYTVTSPADGNGCVPGDCTLRGAILAANANAGADTIAFNIGATGSSQTIAVGATSLPTINDAVTVDGWSQGGIGYTGPPLIEINDPAGAVNGLMASAPVTIQGLVINGFGGTAITLSPGSGGSLVQGNYLGTNASGTAGSPNAGSGVVVRSSGNTIGGVRNVISGNKGAGVVLAAGSNTVSGNYIGTSAGGTAVIGNDDSGVLVSSNSNTITNNVASGATTTSGNGAGIALDSGNPDVPITDNVIQGNFVGTDASGNAALGNSRRGISIVRTSRTTVSGNVISGNSGDGIFLAGGGTQNVIKGNKIGVGADGTTALGQGFGIQISGLSNDTIGGTNPGDGNVIANNAAAGIVITGAASGDNILGNRIYGNGQLGISLGGSPFPTANDAGDSDTGPNSLQNYPVLSGATLSGGNLSLTGTLDTNAGLSNTNFRLEAFLNNSCDASGNGEGEQFVGGTTISVDGSGHADFNVSLPTGATGNFATVTAMSAGTGDSSEFSACKALGSGGGDPPQGGPTFTVNKADDHNDSVCSVADCSLREAITAANATPNGTSPDQITFSIAGGAPHTVSVTSALPSITGPVSIDGADAYIIDGSGAGAGTNGLVFAGVSSNSTVANLQIQNFGNYQIDLRSSGSTIGGVASQGNVLLGNGGVLVESGANTNTIAGNNIGIDAAGVVHAGTQSGVRVDGASGTVIGDNVSPPDHANQSGDKTNVIVGFASPGVYLNAAASTKITGNRIGTNRLGASGMGNSVGVFVTGAGSNNIGPENEIARNSNYGVDVGTAGNRIVANSIHDNGSLGIHVDAAVGISPPTISTAALSGANTTVTGTFSGTASTTFFFEIFKNPTCDDSESGEGQTYMGFAQATTNGSGDATFTFTAPGFALGDVVTATATNTSALSTSEFSNCRTVVPASSGPPPAPGQEPVTVTATDDHPADLRVDLFLDCGAGKPKLPVAVALKPDSVAGTTASFSYNYDPSLACPNGTLKAVGTDGFSSTGFTTAGSAPVNPGPDTPRVAITSPTPSKQFLTYSLFPLRGSARDSNGEIPDSGLTWSLTGPSITRTGTGHQVDLNPPASGGWPTGTYTLTLTGSNGTKSATATTTFTVKTDADNDGMPADVEGQSCFTSGDNDPLNAYSDYDGDGIPNASDGQPCSPATSYSAIADFNPDPLQLGTSNGVVTMSVTIPSRNVAQVLSTSVRLTKIADEDVSTDPRFQSISWTVQNGVGTAKFDRPKLIQYLLSRDIHNRLISITIAGRSGAPPWSFQGSDTVLVQG